MTKKRRILALRETLPRCDKLSHTHLLHRHRCDSAQAIYRLFSCGKRPHFHTASWLLVRRGGLRLLHSHLQASFRSFTENHTRLSLIFLVGPSLHHPSPTSNKTCPSSWLVVRSPSSVPRNLLTCRQIQRASSRSATAKLSRPPPRKHQMAPALVTKQLVQRLKHLRRAFPTIPTCTNKTALISTPATTHLLR